MLIEPGRTAYDLDFGLFGFRVRIHPLFWLGAGLLGANILQSSVLYWLIWIGVVLISITIHELGHAFAYRLCGSDSRIVLYAFGGLAIPDSGVQQRWRRVLISLAGPFAGFALAGLLIAIVLLVHWTPEDRTKWLWFLYFQLIFVNIVWGLVNLLPVFPLDGGQICRELCDRVWHAAGLRISLQISFWVAVTISLYSFICYIDHDMKRHVLAQILPNWFPRGDMYTALLFLVLAAQSYHLLQQINRGLSSGNWNDRLPWER